MLLVCNITNFYKFNTIKMFMFGKIKAKLSQVFSKTQDVIEEDESLDNVSQDTSKNTSNQTSKEISDDTSKEVSQEPEKETQEEVLEVENDSQNKLENKPQDSNTKTPQQAPGEMEPIEDEKRIDRLEHELEDEIDETLREVEEINAIDEEQIQNSDVVEIEHERRDVDRLEQELEHEIDETSREVRELNHEEIEDVEQNSQELQQQDEEVTQEEQSTSKKGGFFSSLFRKKQEPETLKEETQASEPTQKFDNEVHLKDDVQNSQEKEEVSQEVKEDVKEGGFLQSAFSSITQKKIGQSDFDTLWAELELFLLEINIAYEIVEKIEREMKNQVLGHKFSRLSLKQKIKEVLILEITQVMKSKEAHFDTILNEFLEEKQPVVIMMLGVNGTGKTTSIGKIIKHLQNLNKSVVVAAADTFRAAAVEQVEEHCNNLGVKCVKHKQGADPAAVCYDAIEHAKAKNVDVVLIDTAGRMPNNKNLMEELKKIKRVSQTDIVMFIGDSVSGNDLLEQIDLFDKGLGISGVVLTKVDTDERPGSVVTTAYSIDAPIYFLGTGQRYEDLVQFDAKFVAEQLFDEEE